MVYRSSGSFGLVFWSCGLGKLDIKSLSFLCPSVFIFFFSLFPFPSLLLSRSSKLWSSHLLIYFFFNVCRQGGMSCWSQQNCRKALYVSLSSVFREGTAIWLKQESIYILDMSWSWHSLLCTIALWTRPVESLIHWQKARLIPCIWHWTCLSVLLALTCILYLHKPPYVILTPREKFSIVVGVSIVIHLFFHISIVLYFN